MNMILELLYQYSQVEYLTILLLYMSLPAIFFALSFFEPTKFEGRGFSVSLVILSAPIIFIPLQLLMQGLWDQGSHDNYFFALILLLPFLMMSVLATLTYNNRMTFLFPISVLILLGPIYLLGTAPIYPILTFAITYLLTSGVILWMASRTPTYE